MPACYFCCFDFELAYASEPEAPMLLVSLLAFAMPLPTDGIG